MGGVMENALETLFYSFETNALEIPPDTHRIAFLGARFHPFLNVATPAALHLYQYFKPYALVLQGQGFAVSSAPPKPQAQFDMVFILLPKNAVESSHLIALGLEILGPGGVLLCAADNKAGGARLVKTLQGFTVEPVRDVSKNKARAAWITKGEIIAERVSEALTAGAAQEILDGAYRSVPGIFGWDKIDTGSQILADVLAQESLSGAGADFGCGYGFLSQQILQNPAHNITALSCVDADFRALEMCRRNLEALRIEIPVRYFWEDLTMHYQGLSDLDFIIMNPPFHEGQKGDPGIGAAFIATAAKSLKSGGVLWMVANAHLPYEAALKEHFSSVKKKSEAQGFKVYQAAR